MVYEVWEGDLEAVKEKAARVIKKCKKYGCRFTFEEVGETFGSVDGEVFRFVNIEVEGFAACGDWKLLGHIEHTGKGNLLTSYTAEELPEFCKDAVPVCEHCGRKINRVFTYVVINNKTGELKQVGKTCLEDYTGIDLVSALELKNFFHALEEADGEIDRDLRPDWRYLSVLEAMQAAFYVVEKHGYIKKADVAEKRQPSTASRVLGTLYDIKERAYMGNKYKEMAQKAILWAKQFGECGSDYLHNIAVIANSEYVRVKNVGILASIAPAYMREKQNKNSGSEWQGEIGKRFEVDISSATCTTKWDNGYGVTSLYNFTDNAGNIYIWKASKDIDEEIKAGIKHIKGTVKAHTEFRGVKQTELTRCIVSI